eukprot:GEMP01069425.1.p1 GENE.GEMP01069425.1~~GEMP01069425.1.p1  ORF type:complete len:129 (+),score=17.74 GEMP01069425.1:121-507(+)
MALAEVQNSEGWRNVTRFASNIVSRLVKTEHQLALARVRALEGALRRLRRRKLKDAFAALVIEKTEASNEEDFSNPRLKAESILRRLSTIVNNFEFCVESGFVTPQTQERPRLFNSTSTRTSTAGARR